MARKIALLFFLQVFAVWLAVDSFAFSIQELAQGFKSNIGEDSAAGLGVMYPESPYKGVDNDLKVVPIVSLGCKRFFVDTSVFGFNFINNNWFSFSAVGSGRFEGYDSDDSSDLSGMKNRSASFDGGLRALLKAKPFAFTLTGLSDLTDKHNGQEVDAVVSAKLLNKFLRPRIGMRWLSQNVVDYYYGVRSSEATAMRPAYEPDSTVNYLAGVTVAIPLGKRWAFVTDAQYEMLGNKIQDSPIVDEDGLSRYTAGLVYRF